MKKTTLLLALILLVGLAVAFFPSVHAADTYDYDFYGVYDEITGVVSNCTVAAYFSDDDVEFFNVTSGHVAKSWSSEPTHFHYELGTYDREFWVESSDNDTNLYIFNSTELLQYTITFNDLTNKLSSYRYVEMSKNFNGTDLIVEKRKLDSENKIVVSALYNSMYDVNVGSYFYGDLMFDATTAITLDVKGLEFPETVTMGYRYVRAYATRDMETGEIYAYYQDLVDDTDQVWLAIYYQSNNTLVYSHIETDTDEWSFTWDALDNSTDYYLTMQILHNEFGTLNYRQVLPRLYSYSPPWDLSSLGGDSLPFNVNYLIPIMVILAVAGVFSSLNTVVGLFATIVTAGIVAYMGWLPLGIDIFIFVFALVIIYAIVTLRRRTYS